MTTDADEATCYDCAVIGAGPAGLTAALYLARFRRRVIVFDGGGSRARWIPESQNCPGFPGGISGKALLKRLRQQLSGYEVAIHAGGVRTLLKHDEAFVLTTDDERAFTARKVLLATGIVDVLPDVDWVEAAIEVGALRLCPVCDGYEASDQRIAVYGPSGSGLDHAVFLRTYSANVALVCSDESAVGEELRERAARQGVRIIEDARDLRFDGGRCSFARADGSRERFDTVYPFLGSHARSELATAVGAASDESGALKVGGDQMTSVEGLYAAGDVVSSLNQISVAVGHSGVAATAMHNALAGNPR